MTRGRWIALIVIATLIAAFFALGLHRYFTLDNFKAQQGAIVQYRDAHPVLSTAIFFGIYVAVAALSLPGALIMTLSGGAIFGLLWGLVVVSFASSVGATVAFLNARYVLRDAIQSRYAEKLKNINEGIEREGGFYLFSLRLVPIFPFFLVNAVMGLTPIRTRTFYWVSQLGMLPATAIYVNAGTQLAKLDSLRGILSPVLLGSFALLGLFPLIAKKAVAALKRRRPS